MIMRVWESQATVISGQMLSSISKSSAASPGLFCPEGGVTFIRHQIEYEEVHEDQDGSR